MPSIPREKGPDSTLALMRDPYRYISRRCREHNSDLFEARILLQPTICMTGRDAAELFYDTSRFKRSGAAPKRAQKTLFGQGGVQGLDGDAHRHRKAMLLSIATPERVEALAQQTVPWWRSYAEDWRRGGHVVLYPQVQEILFRSVCGWAGVPLKEANVPRQTRDIAALFEYAGNVGPRHWKARRARRRANRWGAKFIERIRRGEMTPPEPSAAQVIAWHRDLQGDLLSPHVAAVELLNVLRPTVAVAVYVVLAALALHEHPECAPGLDDDAALKPFVQEVRRFYPFFPFVAARTKQRFEWRGYFFPAGRRVFLDLYGTNHDERIWERPDQFRPDRFGGAEPDPFGFIPQGGGDQLANHRCPGEGIAIELTKTAVQFLRRDLRYRVPPQDLTMQFSRLPALPRSGMIIDEVQLR